LQIPGIRLEHVHGQCEVWQLPAEGHGTEDGRKGCPRGGLSPSSQVLIVLVIFYHYNTLQNHQIPPKYYHRNYSMYSHNKGKEYWHSPNYRINTLWNKSINRKSSILKYFIMTSIFISKCYFRMAGAQRLAGGSRGMTDVQTHWTTRTLTLNRDPTGNMTLNYDIWIMSLNFENTSEMCTITNLTFYYDLWILACVFNVYFKLRL